ncbi:hypothetical protein [Virgibacillus chiguensis]|uniref:Uncharacterized protein n=1 Tax=Virgibacillus chiguensis TaxID=411959 RepID=A0A1M5RIL8_9BACI|nr:hypothetical protein [Virgibacillus chiguensis]SHH25958.1 hypothetical protein SAMN05421807_105170 [Virgibacillus chiguensis]
MGIRKETYRRRRYSNLKKIIIVSLLCMLIAVGSFYPVFADEDIGGMVTDWLQQKTDDAIQTVDEAILKEEKEQTERLRKALRVKKQEAEQKLIHTADQEITARTEELERYADELIKSLNKKQTEENQAAIKKEFEAIVKEAKGKMEDASVLHDEHEEFGK